MHYSPNNSSYLDRLRKHSGFSDLPLLEKLVLDFEMLYHLKDKFDMVVKGGMASLLHAEPSPHRINEDIDVITTAPKSQMASILAGLGTGDEEAAIKIEGKRARQPATRTRSFSPCCAPGTSWNTTQTATRNGTPKSSMGPSAVMRRPKRQGGHQRQIPARWPRSARRTPTSRPSAPPSRMPSGRSSSRRLPRCSPSPRHGRG